VVVPKSTLKDCFSKTNMEIGLKLLFPKWMFPVWWEKYVIRNKVLIMIIALKSIIVKNARSI